MSGAAWDSIVESCARGDRASLDALCREVGADKKLQGPALQSEVGTVAWEEACANLQGRLAQTPTPLRSELSAPDRHGWTLLHFAAYRGNLKTCKLLLALGASAAAPNAVGQAPADLAPAGGATRALFAAAAKTGRRARELKKRAAVLPRPLRNEAVPKGKIQGKTQGKTDRKTESGPAAPTARGDGAASSFSFESDYRSAKSQKPRAALVARTVQRAEHWTEHWAEQASSVEQDIDLWGGKKTASAATARALSAAARARAAAANQAEKLKKKWRVADHEVRRLEAAVKRCQAGLKPQWLAAKPSKEASTGDRSPGGPSGGLCFDGEGNPGSNPAREGPPVAIGEALAEAEWALDSARRAFPHEVEVHRAEVARLGLAFDQATVRLNSLEAAAREARARRARYASLGRGLLGTAKPNASLQNAGEGLDLTSARAVYAAALVRHGEAKAGDRKLPPPPPKSTECATKFRAEDWAYPEDAGLRACLRAATAAAKESARNHAPPFVPKSNAREAIEVHCRVLRLRRIVSSPLEAGPKAEAEAGVVVRVLSLVGGSAEVALETAPLFPPPVHPEEKPAEDPACSDWAAVGCTASTVRVAIRADESFDESFEEEAGQNLELAVSVLKLSAAPHHHPEGRASGRQRTGLRSLGEPTPLPLPLSRAHVQHGSERLLGLGTWRVLAGGYEVEGEVAATLRRSAFTWSFKDSAVDVAADVALEDDLQRRQVSLLPDSSPKTSPGPQAGGSRSRIASTTYLIRNHSPNMNSYWLFPNW